MPEAEEPPRSVRVKRIAVHARVSGKFGDFIDNDLSGRRRTRSRIFGTVVEAVDSKRYKVIFDNGQLLECYSNSLKVETSGSLPPDLAPATTLDVDTPPLLPVPPQTDALPIDPPMNLPIPEDDDLSMEEHLPGYRQD